MAYTMAASRGAFGQQAAAPAKAPAQIPQTTRPLPQVGRGSVGGADPFGGLDLDRLSAEHEQLTTHGRVDIARKIQAAREMGDLSENGDYHAAKEEQGKMEARIRQLQALLLDAEIVEAADGSAVVAGVIVSIRYEGDDEVERLLVGSVEERGELEVLTPGSPLGVALMGAKVGDIVDFEAPGGVLKVEIVAIEA
jgi:transcription elongation factor GreA